ncbi:unnamed protein product [Bubo scandiacus]
MDIRSCLDSNPDFAALVRALIDVTMGCNFWFENPEEMIRNGQVKDSYAGQMLTCAEEGEQTSMAHLGVYMPGRHTHRIEWCLQYTGSDADRHVAVGSSMQGPWG